MFLIEFDKEKTKHLVKSNSKYLSLDMSKHIDETWSRNKYN